MRCLVTLCDQDFPRGQYEIIVVDDGSTDGTAESLSGFPLAKNLVVISQPENRGQAAARNIGARKAKGRLLLFLDDDMSCDHRLLSSHVTSHANRANPGLVFGCTQTALGQRYTFAAETTAIFLDQHYERLERDQHLKWPDDAWAGQNSSIARSTFLECGGYDEIRFARRFEDTELGLRLWRRGIDFHFEPRAIVWHWWAKSNRQVWNDCKLQGASIVMLCRMYPELRPVWGYVGVVTAPIWKRYSARILATAPWLAMVTLGGLVAVFERMPDRSWLRRIGSRLYSILGGVVALAGAQRAAGSWSELRKLFGPRLPVLLYHHIGTPTSFTRQYQLTVRPAKFQRHMRWLRRLGYSPITPAQWLAWREAGIPIPDKPVLLTFDDGYADIAKYALPILRHYGFTATIFVLTDRRCWEGLPVMTMEDILYWATRGIEVGVHTRTHPDLTSVTSSVLRGEIIGCKSDLAQAGVTTISFAYPYGYYDDRVRLAVADDFRIAFTCEKGLNDLRTDPLLMRRTIVHPGDTLLDIVLRLRFGWSPRGWLSQYFRLLSRRLVGIVRILRRFDVA
jgi:peptidoglycan/xylan/chitin deacetylase (PgdA/CDA1 family)/glycosyltransferase involved in cell wall biosynthesis